MKGIKKKESFMAEILLFSCEKVGAKLLMGPENGANGQILFSNKDKRVSFFNCCFDINQYGSSLIARNKGLTRVILEKEKIKFAKGKYFSLNSDEYKDFTLNKLNKLIIGYAEKINFPIMLKGADLHRGTCVHFITNKKELKDTLPLIWDQTKHLVVEKYIPFKSYRILVFDKKIIAVYEKTPLSIIGDGASAIKELIKNQIKDKCIDISKKSKDIGKIMYEYLNSIGLSDKSIIEKNKKIALLNTCNISTGGKAIDVTSKINKDFSVYVNKIMKTLNLRLAGIDIVSPDIELSSGKAYLLEVNSSPSLETYAELGKVQRLVIEQLVEDIIKKMSKI